MRHFARITMEKITGKILFYEDKGPKDGYWAFQELKFITLCEPMFGLNENQKVWNINDRSKYGKVIKQTEVLIDNVWLEWPDPISKEFDYKISSLFMGEIKGDLNADKRLSDKYNFRIKYAIQRLNEKYGINNWKFDKNLPNIILKDGTQVHFGETPDTEPSRPYGISQNGLTRVKVEWSDGTIENNCLSSSLLVEKWDFKGLHFLKDNDYLTIYDYKKSSIKWSGKLKFDNSHPKLPILEGINIEEWKEYFSKNYHAELEIEK